MNESEEITVARFEPINRNQIVLAPLNMERLIPHDHPARNIWEFLGRMLAPYFQILVRSSSSPTDCLLPAAYFLSASE
jgi:hypothetical protein